MSTGSWFWMFWLHRMTAVPLCPQLWPGILSTKACLPVEVLMGLCSSGTQGKGVFVVRNRWCPAGFTRSCLLLLVTGWRRRSEGWRWLMRG